KADYLDHAKRLRRSPRYAASQHADSAVGFGAFKGDAKMAQAMHYLGKGHIHEVWTYQGSKPFVHRARLYAAHGDTVSSAEPTMGRSIEASSGRVVRTHWGGFWPFRGTPRFLWA